MGKKILIYNHAGSRNHGCEALVRTVVSHLPEDSFVTLLSDAPEEERMYGIDKIVDEIRPSKIHYSKISLDFFYSYFQLKIKKNYFPLDLMPYKTAINNLDSDYDLALSIGGDVYCYENYPLYILIHKLIKKIAKKTILVGCSLENDLFSDQAFIKDIKSYDLVLARESLTFSLLKNNNIKPAKLIPDSAFTLDISPTEIPKCVNGSVGINISPLIIKKNNGSSIVIDNYRFLIKSLLTNTSYHITLIPHVSWENNDDREPLGTLYNEFSATGRVTLINDLSCEKIKYIIAQCIFFVGARTHSTIAAYSSGIPTLVVGYSIKSRGIAIDLFGTSDNYVVPVSDLKNTDDIWTRFEWIMNHENEIKVALQSKIESYKHAIDHDLKRVFEE